MTESGKTPIVRQIANNVNLYTGREGTPTVIPSIIYPTYEVQGGGRKNTIFGDQTVTGAGQKDLYFVPENEWWTIHFLQVAITTGTMTIGSINCLLPGTDINLDIGNASSWHDREKWLAGQSKVFTFFVDAGVTYMLYKDKDFRIPPNSTIGVVIDGHSVTGVMEYILYTTVDIY